MKNFVVLLASILLFSGSTVAATCVSLGNGNWNSPLTWSCGHVPIGGDIVTIQAGDTVSISVGTDIIGLAIILNIDGVFLFDSPGAQLRLPCRSVIIISATGSIESAGVGQASHSIRICRNAVWTGTDGPLTGPLVIGIVLPIELTFFNAETNGSMIDFTWQTASEKNNDFFTIEGSIDGFSWNEMRRINGAGSTQKEQNYSSEVENQDNYAYFRLKQTDFDGEFVYSDILAVDLVRDQMKIYPNPNNGLVLNIEFPSKDLGMLQISHADGRVAYSVELTGSQELQVTDLNLKAGTYLVQVQQNGQILNERLVIQ